jgi:hypothetical protein
VPDFPFKNVIQPWNEFGRNCFWSVLGVGTLYYKLNFINEINNNETYKLKLKRIILPDEAKSAEKRFEN